MSAGMRIASFLTPEGPSFGLVAGSCMTARDTTSATGAAVSIRGLTRRFGANTVLHGLHLKLEPGSFTALLGRSGSGKTTLLRTLAGLDPVPAEADVALPGAVAAVFQKPRLLPWKKVWQNVSLGLAGDDPRGRAARALSEVGLSRHADA